MPNRCPTCDRPAIGATAVTLRTRGTGNRVTAAICPECGTVYRSKEELDDD